MPRTLVLTGHLTPSFGGVRTFTEQLLRRLDPNRLVVVAPATPSAQTYDRHLGVPVARRPLATMLRDAGRIARDAECTAAWLPAAVPYGLAAPLLRRFGIERLVASTHGQETAAWLRSPPGRAALRSVARSVDVLTYLGPYAEAKLRSIVPDSSILCELSGGVDTRLFTVRPDDSIGRQRPPTVVTLSRIVPRKGHDALLHSWLLVRAVVPDARLVIIGEGPGRRRLERLVSRLRLCGQVRFTGQLAAGDVVRELHDADVFAAPCRDRLGGLLTEGLGLSVLEASATGLPVVVGRSGGSPDTVVDGRTGLLVDAADPAELARALLALLLDPRRARHMGGAGRAWVSKRWCWERSSSRLTGLLAGAGPHVPKID